MDTNVEFITTPWCEQNEISTLHLSFLVQTLLPLHTIKWDSVKRHYHSINLDIQEKFTGDEDLHCVSTGSMAEGYSIPSSVRRDDSSAEQFNEILSDVDILCVMSKIKVSTDELHCDQHKTDVKGCFEYIDDCPGYVRIRVLNPKAEDDIFVVDLVTGKCYLSGIKWTEKIFSKIQNTHDVIRQGPAISLVDESMSEKLKLNEGISTDLVFALSCFPWPSIANNWKLRAQNSPWLTADVVSSIISDGCHVVAVPSKNSSNPELEWRLSFSASEGKLAREAVTDYQRQCFIYVKILHHQKIKPKGILSSYMVKSVFLYCCEKIPVSYWREYPGSCILYILDVVLDCLKKKHIPTYFLPENNLIRHLNEDEIKQAIDDVEEVLKDPVTPVLEFTDNRIFSRHSALISFRQMVFPLIEDMTACNHHMDPTQSIMNAVMKTGYNICLFFLAEESEDEGAALFKYQEGLRHLINIYMFWLKPPNTNLAQFINRTGLSIKTPMRCLRFFEAATSLSNEYPELASLRGNLACQYHGISYMKGLSEQKREAYLTKAEELFKVLYDDSSDSLIDYVVFLVKRDRLNAAKYILQRFLRENGGGKTKSYYSYDLKESECLVEPLKKHVELHRKISGDALSFAYFYLVYCLTYNKSEDDSCRLKDVLEDFNDYCDKHKDTDAFVLLNYAKTL